MLVASVGLARPSSVRIGLETTGSFKPRVAEVDAKTRGGGREKRDRPNYARRLGVHTRLLSSVRTIVGICRLSPEVAVVCCMFTSRPLSLKHCPSPSLSPTCDSDALDHVIQSIQIDIAKKHFITVLWIKTYHTQNASQRLRSYVCRSHAGDRSTRASHDYKKH